MPIDAQLLERIKANDPHLTGLDLIAEGVNDDGAQALAKALEQNHTLTGIVLWDNDIGDAGAQALAKALEKNRTLTRLDLAGNRIGVEGAQGLAKMLEQNRTLIKFQLHNNQIRDGGAQALAKALEKNHTLTKLDLAGNQIGIEGAQGLAKMLEENRALIQFQLHSNQIRDAGAQALAKALEQNRMLTWINLGDNQIGDVGAQALAKTLEQNHTLVSIDLHTNQINSLLKKTVHDLAAENQKRAESLLAAVQENNLTLVRKLLNERVGCNYVNSNYSINNVLHLAAIKGHVDIVSLLLAFGANKSLANGYGRTALQLAEENHHQAIVDLLQEQKPTVEAILEATVSSSKVVELSTKKQAEELFNQGYAEYKAANYEVALISFNEAIQLNPKQANYFNYRCKVKLALHQFTLALEDVSQAILLKPKRALYYAQRAAIKVALQNYQSAIEDYDQAIRYKSSKAHYFYDRGKAKEELKQYAEALKDYEQAMQLDENYAEATGALVTIKALLKPLQTSTETTVATSSHAMPGMLSETRAIKKEAESLYAEAKTYLEDGKISEAKIAYRKAQDTYKELKSLGVDCQKRLDKIKAKLTELKQPQAVSSSSSEISVAPPLRKKNSVTELPDLTTTLPADNIKRFNPPTANAKAGFFKQPVSASSLTSQASSSQVNSVNGLGNLLQAQPGERSSINTAQSQLSK